VGPQQPWNATPSGSIRPFLFQHTRRPKSQQGPKLECLQQSRCKNISKRLIAIARIKEVCEAAILGDKKKRIRRRQKIEQNMQRVRAVHEDIESIRTKLGEDAFVELKEKLEARLMDTWQSTRVLQAKAKFAAALLVTHVASSKELAEGFNISPLLEGKLQLGKLFSTKGCNLSLFRNELKNGKWENGHVNKLKQYRKSS
jgi:hypothetical protein